MLTATLVPVGQALRRLTSFNEAMALALEVRFSFPNGLLNALTDDFVTPQAENIERLRSVVNEYFTETGIIKYSLYDKTANLRKVFGTSHSRFSIPSFPR